MQPCRHQIVFVNVADYLVLVILVFVDADNWYGSTISSRLGDIIIEGPSLLTWVLFCLGTQHGKLIKILIIVWWLYGKLSLGFCVFRPVRNFNEVTHHHVECIHQHIVHQKLQVELFFSPTKFASMFKKIEFAPKLFTLDLLISSQQKGESLPQSQTMDASHSTPVKVESNGIHSSPSNQVSLRP